MLKTLFRKSTPLFMLLFTIALTVGTAFAQDAEATTSSSASGLTQAVLFIGMGAIALVLFASWSQSISDDDE